MMNRPASGVSGAEDRGGVHLAGEPARENRLVSGKFNHRAGKKGGEDSYLGREWLVRFYWSSCTRQEAASRAGEHRWWMRRE